MHKLFNSIENNISKDKSAPSTISTSLPIITTTNQNSNNTEKIITKPRRSESFPDIEDEERFRRLSERSCKTWSWKEGEEFAIFKVLRFCSREQTFAGILNDIDINTIRRCLIARDYNEEPAATLLKTIYEWRSAYEPHKVRKNEVVQFIKDGSMFLHGEDKLGRPCIVIGPGKHKPVKDPKHKLRAIIYWLEKAIKAMREDVLQYVLLVDMVGFGMENLDWPFVQEFAKLTDYYPERLGACFVIRGGLITKSLWKVGSKWLDARTKSKVHIFNDHYKTQLTQYFTPQNLLKIHGGTSTYNFIQQDLFRSSIETSSDDEPNSAPKTTAKPPNNNDSFNENEAEHEITKILTRSLEISGISLRSKSEDLLDNTKEPNSKANVN